MLLSKIGEEYMELNKIIGNARLFEKYKKLYYAEDRRRDILLSWSGDIRRLSRMQVILENKKFESQAVQKRVDEYILCSERIFERYDMIIGNIFKEEKDVNIINNSIEGLYESIERLEKIILKSRIAYVTIGDIMDETWEPLPNDEKEDKVENIVISSETRSLSLNDVASDIGNLDSFFKNVCQLIQQDQNQSNNIYLRRIETGSLTVAVSCAMQSAPIIAFIFWCVNHYQKAEKRYLDNEEKKLKLINDSMDIAKEILKVDPDNKEAEEIIQKCGVHVLNFLENNPTGTINGEHYDIGIEKLKIEDKEKSN